MTLQEIANRVAECTRCELRQTATAPVPGIGEVDCKYMILGLAPGRDEDLAGVPFVGLSGKRLDKLMKLAEIDPNECYITNICKCRPPDDKDHRKNRDPKKKEIRACLPWLNEELKLIKPPKIIVLGGLPLSLFSSYGITQLHGTCFDFEIPEGGLTI